MVTLTIDGKEVSVPEHTTILNAAYQAGSMIPTLCYLKDINEIGACRICVVEVEGTDKLVSSCNNEVARRHGGKHHEPPCCCLPPRNDGAYSFAS